VAESEYRWILRGRPIGGAGVPIPFGSLEADGESQGEAFDESGKRT